MARFVTAIDGRPHGREILSAGSLRQMTARPAPPLWAGSDSWYGMGWQVRPAGQGFNWWHTGGLAGTATLMVRAGNGVTWVVFFNSNPPESPDDFGADLDNSMWKALAEVRRWPTRDLFTPPLGAPSQPPK